MTKIAAQESLRGKVILKLLSLRADTTVHSPVCLCAAAGYKAGQVEPCGEVFEEGERLNRPPSLDFRLKSHYIQFVGQWGRFSVTHNNEIGDIIVWKKAQINCQI